MWRNFAAALSLFPTGMYISDIHLSGHSNDLRAKAFKFMLSTFVRRSVHNHFKTPAEVTFALAACGFNHSAAVHDPIEFAAVDDNESTGSSDHVRAQDRPYCRTPGARRVNIIDAKTSF